MALGLYRRPVKGQAGEEARICSVGEQSEMVGTGDSRFSSRSERLLLRKKREGEALAERYAHWRSTSRLKPLPPGFINHHRNCDRAGILSARLIARLPDHR